MRASRRLLAARGLLSAPGYRVSIVALRELVYAAVLSVAVAVAVVTSAASYAATRPTPPATGLASGTTLYRQFCGQCHALSEALSAGFGNNSKGIGRNGGPSFNLLRIPYRYSIAAVTEPTGGHELVAKKITMAQLIKVSKYVATVTSGHPLPALPTDG